MNYNDQLNELFDNWKIESAKNNEPREKTEEAKVIFTEDGIMEKSDDLKINVEEAWHNSEKRIMFILKDQPSEWCNDARLWLKIKDNQNLKPRFIRNLANIFWGLYNADKNNLCSYNDLKNSTDSVRLCFNTQPFAFIESKKQGGMTYISNTTLISYLKKYKEFLIKEIKILNPNIIVCTSHIIYRFVCEIFNKEELQAIESVNQNCFRIHKPSNTIIIKSFHPSARKSEKDIYESVMANYRKFITSEH